MKDQRRPDEMNYSVCVVMVLTGESCCLIVVVVAEHISRCDFVQIYIIIYLFVCSFIYLCYAIHVHLCWCHALQ